MHPLGWTQALAGSCLALAIAGASARGDFMDPASRASLRIPVSYRAWTLDPRGAGRSSSLSEFYAPVSSTVHLGESAELRVRAAAATSRLEPSAGGRVTLDGATDASTALLTRLFGDRLLLQLGVNLPSGNETLTPAELDLSRVLGEPLLGFPLREFGRGLDLEFGIATALPAGDRLLLGLGGGFVRRGEYGLLSEGGDYDPGDESSLVAGVDWVGAEAGESPWRLDLAYRTYTQDALGGRRVFAEGDQVEAQVELNLHAGRSRASLLLRGAHKGDNVAYGASGDSVAPIQASPGLQSAASLTLERPISTSLRAGIAGEWRRHSGSDALLVAGKAPARDGDAGGLALLAGWTVADPLDLALRAEWLRGAFGGDDLGDVDLRGFGIGVTLSYAAGGPR